MFVITQHSYYRRCKTKYRWRSVDAHFQDVVGRLSILVLHIKAANTSKRTLTYHGQYYTINSRISECDHKCETRNAELEIGTDRSSQTRRNPRVDGCGSGFGPPRVCGSGFWTVPEPNRPVFVVQTRTASGLPGPVANTTQGSIESSVVHTQPQSAVLLLRKWDWCCRRRCLSFPALGLTRSFWDFIDPRNLCGSSRPGTLSFPLTLFLHFPSQNRSSSRIPFGCLETYGARVGISLLHTST